MASPFRVFRKYQKTLLVVAGVVLMFVFVIGDSLFSYMNSSRSAAGDEHDAQTVAVHWDGGKLTNAQLNDLLFRRRILNTFLRQVQMEGERPSYMAGVEPQPLRVQPLMAPETERSVVQTKLYADAARDAGMKVGAETAVQYLDELGRGNVSRENMRAILKQMQGGGGRFSIDHVIDALREVMLASNYEKSHQFAWQTVTPQQRWKDWLRVNDRVVVEAAAVPAESFLDKVDAPTETQIAEFYEKYKDVESGPDQTVMNDFNIELPSPNPGFRVPRKIDLQFIQANYDDFLAKAEAKITDEEIAKYYDENKKLFEKADTGLMEDVSKKDDQKSDTPAAKADEKKDAKEEKSKDEEKKSDAADTKNATEPAKPEAPTSAAPGAATDSKPAPAEDRKAEEKPPADKPKNEEKKTSDRPHPAKRVFRLAAFQEDATKKKDADAKNESASPDTKSTKPAEPPAAAVDAKPAPGADKPADSGSAAVPDSKAADPAAKPAASPAADSPASPAATSPPAEKKPVEYQPLSEVKDLIRKQLAEGKVAEQLKELTGKIQTELDREFNAWRYSESAASKVDAPPKALTDLAAIAEKNGLKFVQTGPKTLLELRDLPIGKSSATDSGHPLLLLLFGSSEMDLYQPKTTLDIDGNRYVVMKMADAPGKVPALADVKNEVVSAWKKQKASELALKEAQELAKKAQDEKKPLTDVFADDKSVKMVKTDPFAELTAGDVGQRRQQTYRLSQPDGIVAAGPEFMTRVFGMKDGEVAAILNHDHSIAYVVRVVDHQPGLPELRTAYLSESESWPGQISMAQDHFQAVARNLQRDIMDGANLTWDRAPDRVSQEQPVGEE